MAIKRIKRSGRMGKIRKRVTKSKHSDTGHVGREERAIVAQAREFDDDDLQSIIDGTETPEEKHSRNTMTRASEEELELRRRSILRLTLRGVPKPKIREFLQISQATLYRDLEAINDVMREEVNNFDLPLFVGQTIHFFRDVRNIAYRMATDPNVKDNRLKLMALRTAVEVEREQHKYLSLTGLYGKAEASHALYRNVTGADDEVDDAADFGKFFENYYQSERPEPEIVEG